MEEVVDEEDKQDEEDEQDEDENKNKNNIRAGSLVVVRLTKKNDEEKSLQFARSRSRRKRKRQTNKHYSAHARAVQKRYSLNDPRRIAWDSAEGVCSLSLFSLRTSANRFWKKEMEEYEKKEDGAAAGARERRQTGMLNTVKDSPTPFLSALFVSVVVVVVGFF